MALAKAVSTRATASRSMAWTPQWGYLDDDGAGVPCLHITHKDQKSMNTKNTLTSLIAGAALLLPAGAFAQAGSDTSGASGASRQYQGSTSATQDTSAQGQQSSSQGRLGSSSDPYSSSSQHGMSGSQHASTHSSSASIKRVSQDQLKDRVTAESLKGKKVVDRNGQKVGKVKDVGLSDALSGGQSTASIGSSQSSGIGQSSTTVSGLPSQSQSGSVNILVELDDAVGEGSELASIPASSLEFDRQNDQLKLDMGSQELAAVLE